MEPNHPYLLPRSVPTSAAVMFHKCKHNVVQDLESSPAGYAIVRANTEELLTVCTGSSTGVPISEGMDFPDRPNTIVIDKPGEVSFGGHYVNALGQRVGPYLDEKDGVSAIQPDGSTLPDACWVWDVSAAAGQTITVVGSTLGLVGKLVIARNYATNASIVSGAFANVDSRAQVTLTFSAAVNAKIYFHYNLNSLGSFGNFYFSSGWTMNLLPQRLVYSLWDLLGNVQGAEISRTQFNVAAKYSFTGLSCLLQNTTAVQYKSGSIVCAQLPGGTYDDLPLDPIEMYNMIGSYNDPKTFAGELKNGAHWFFVPEKLPDWFFRATTDSDGDRPFFVAAWNGVAVNELANKLGLTLLFGINIELLTSDISLMKFLPTADLSRLMDLFVTMVAAHNTVSENPGHKAKIKKIITAIMKSPYTRDALVSMAKAGTKLIPLALAAIP